MILKDTDTAIHSNHLYRNAINLLINPKADCHLNTVSKNFKFRNLQCTIKHKWNFNYTQLPLYPLNACYRSASVRKSSMDDFIGC